MTGADDRDEALTRVREALTDVLPTADGRILACGVSIEGAWPSPRKRGDL